MDVLDSSALLGYVPNSYLVVEPLGLLQTTKTRE